MSRNMPYSDHHSLIWAGSNSSRSWSPSSQKNVSTAMRRATIVLILIITLVFLLLNIYGLLEIWKFIKEARKRPPSLETIVRQQQEEAAKKNEERLKEIEFERVETTPVPTLPPWPSTYSTTRRTTTYPPTTIIPWWFHTRDRARITPQVRTFPTIRYTPSTPTTSTSTTTRPTTTTERETTRIHVTRPPSTPEPSVSPRIEVTRPHGHRHHGHHHHHTPPPDPIFIIEAETETAETTETTTSSTTLSTSTARPTTSVTTYRPVQSWNDEEVTIVTALVDIGRGDWWEYRRPLEKYHEFMENLLSLRNNMVIFVDHSSHDFVHKYRKNMGLMHQTKIHLITLEDLPLSRHLPYAQKIIEDELKTGTLYRFDQSIRGHPEAKSAEYDVLVCSKTYFLYNATLEDPFKTDKFAWIDAGYGHGNQSVYPYDNIWKPMFPKGKVSVIKITPEHDLIRTYNIDKLYRKNWSVISGGFIGGDKRSLGQLHTIVHNKFIHLIYQNKVDDDQTVMVLAINSYPHLFSIQQGGWFDAFRLFSTDAEINFGR